MNATAARYAITADIPFEIILLNEKVKDKGNYSEQNLRAAYYWAKLNGYDNIWQPKKMIEGVRMGKLVRDKIPQIIRDDGKEPIVEILSEEDYLIELDKKLNEEVAEYQADKSLEEMADVLEVLFAICEARGHSVDELMQIREEKREKRGGFKDRIYWMR